MRRLAIALSIGVGAGIVDVIPMIPLGTNRAAQLSAFLHWIVLGFVICYLQLGVPAFLKGIIVGVASAAPVIALVYDADPHASVPILVMSAVLGAAVGYLTDRFAHA